MSLIRDPETGFVTGPVNPVFAFTTRMMFVPPRLWAQALLAMLPKRGGEVTLDEYRALPKRRAKPRSPEFALTVEVADFLKRALPNRLWTHFPAGEHRDNRTGAKLRAMGLRPGWPDFLFVLPGGRLGCIELKAAKGRLSDHQVAFRDQAVSEGVRWAECRSTDEVIATLQSWDALTTARAA